MASGRPAAQRYPPGPHLPILGSCHHLCIGFSFWYLSAPSLKLANKAGGVCHILSLASQQRRKGRGTGLIFAGLLLYSGRAALCRCPPGSYWQNWISSLSVGQSLVKTKTGLPLAWVTPRINVCLIRRGRYRQMAVGRARNTVHPKGPGPGLLPILQKLYRPMQCPWAFPRIAHVKQLPTR